MEKKDLRIVFMGTPEFAVDTLKALVENDYNVVAVVTQPDKPVGRHQTEMQPSEVKKYALRSPCIKVFLSGIESIRRLISAASSASK